MNIETITSLARKLAALSAPGNGATDAERQTAAAKLAALLKRHGLTTEAIADNRLHTLVIHCETEQEVNLLIQVVADIRNTNSVKYFHRPVSIPALGKNGKPTKRLRKVKQITLENLTLAEYTDIDACYSHYVKILRKLLGELNQELRSIARRRKNAVAAMSVRYDLGPQTGEVPAKPLTPEQLADLVATMRACSGDAWQRPAANLDSDTPLIASA